MAFARSALVRASSGANTTSSALWMYQTADTIGTVAGSNYFDSAHKELMVNDVIIVVGSTGGTQSMDIKFVDTISAAGVVALSAVDINGA